MISKHKAVNDLLDRACKASQFPVNILITGESGTGKEVLARFIHDRTVELGSKGRFIGVNCSALPEHLLESELFGHVKGAFTGAASNKKGLFVEAEGGTLLLDEIGDMPLPLQAKLLRTLEEKHVRPVGGTKDIPFNCRVISATNQDIVRAINEGSFRADLFYRLNTVVLETVPLRFRKLDILPLAKFFIRQAKLLYGIDQPIKLADTAIQSLLEHTWPGNIRELKNTIESSIINNYSSHSEEIVIKNVELSSEYSTLNDHIFTWSLETDGTLVKDATTALERFIIEHVYEKTQSVYQTATITGLTYPTVRNKVSHLMPKK